MRLLVLLVACAACSVLLPPVLLYGFSSPDPRQLQPYASRDLLRVFESRGTTGIPILSQTDGSFINPLSTPAGTQQLILYAQDVGLPAAAGIIIGVICLVAACTIWCCRCCCNSCCKGDPDPESKHTVVRILIAVFAVLVFVGAWIGLAGGLLVTSAIRTFMTSVIRIGARYKALLEALALLLTQIGISNMTFDMVASVVGNVLDSLTLVSQFITPFDIARLFILYVGLSLAMLAAITLGIGVLLRRKQVTSTGFVCAAIAVVFAWFNFGINLPLAIILDDSCQTAENIVAFQAANNGQVGFLVQCTPDSTVSDVIGEVRTFQGDSLERMRTLQDRANAANAPRVVYPTLVARSDLDPCMADMSSGLWTRTTSLCMEQVAEDTYNVTFPAWRACDLDPSCVKVGNDNVEMFNEITNAANVRRGLEIVNELIDCATVAGLLDLFRSSICTELIVGTLLIFVGSIIIGAFLIPAVLMGLWVAQKFPNRAAAARLKSRLMVLFSFQFFHAIVALVGELRPDAIEIVLSVLTIIAGLAGFAFLNIPMNKLNWSPTAQMVLAFVLAVIELGLAGGWIYLLYINAVETERCVSVLYGTNILSLVGGASPMPAPANSMDVCLDQNWFSHKALTAILSGTSTILAILGMVTGIVLLIQIKCGYELNLNDSDYELD